MDDLRPKAWELVRESSKKFDGNNIFIIFDQIKNFLMGRALQTIQILVACKASEYPLDQKNQKEFN